MTDQPPESAPESERLQAAKDVVAQLMDETLIENGFGYDKGRKSIIETALDGITNPETRNQLVMALARHGGLMQRSAIAAVDAMLNPP